MSKKDSKVDWGVVWEKFDRWFNNRDQSKLCPKCRHLSYDEPEWDGQQKKIVQLVENQLKGK